MLTRRRFITIAAAIAPSAALSHGLVPHVETGRALGATVTLRLVHPEAPSLATLAMAEIRRLEHIFSLYQPGSALSRLNRAARLRPTTRKILRCKIPAQTITHPPSNRPPRR